MKSVKSNFLYNAAYQLLTILLPLLTTPYLSRVLGAGGIGQYSYSYSVAFYFVMFAQLGLRNYGNRETAKVRDDRLQVSRTFWSIYWMQAIGSVAVIGAYLCYCLCLGGSGIMAVAMIPYVISGGLDITWFFEGLEEFKITVTRNAVIKILSTAAVFLLVKEPSDALVYSIILSVSFLLSQVLIWPYLKGRVQWARVTKKDIVRHIKPNLLLFIPVVAISLYKIMDKIMLGGMADEVQVGFYESSERIMQVPIALVTSLGTVMLPRMTNLYARKDTQTAQRDFGKSIELAMFLSTALGFGIMAVAKTFVPWYYGAGFESCIRLFWVLMPSCLFLAFANVIRTQYLIPHGEDKVYILSVIVGAVINLAVNLILIPKMGAVGAAVGTLAAEGSVCVVQTYCVRRQLPVVRCLLLTVPYVAAGALLLGVVSGVSFPMLPEVLDLLCQIFLGVAVYFAFLMPYFWWRKRRKTN